MPGGPHHPWRWLQAEHKVLCRDLAVHPRVPVTALRALRVAPWVGRRTTVPAHYHPLEPQISFNFSQPVTPFQVA